MAEARRWKIRETGGALLGWRDGTDSVVARVLGPGPKAVHRRHSFEPDGEWQNRRGAAIYRASGRTIAYLGDWHTHPLGSPRPSKQDKDTALLIADDADFRTPTPLYAIIGRSTWPASRRRRCQLAVYEVHGKELVPAQIEIVEPFADPA